MMCGFEAPKPGRKLGLLSPLIGCGRLFCRWFCQFGTHCVPNWGEFEPVCRSVWAFLGYPIQPSFTRHFGEIVYNSTSCCVQKRTLRQLRNTALKRLLLTIIHLAVRNPAHSTISPERASWLFISGLGRGVYDPSSFSRFPRNHSK